MFDNSENILNALMRSIVVWIFNPSGHAPTLFLLLSLRFFQNLWRFFPGAFYNIVEIGPFKFLNRIAKYSA